MYIIDAKIVSLNNAVLIHSCINARSNYFTLLNDSLQIKVKVFRSNKEIYKEIYRMIIGMIA
jgi:hypothetical protein